MCTRSQLGDRLPEDSPSPEDLQITSEDNVGGVTRLEVSDGRGGGQSYLPSRLAEGSGVLPLQGGGAPSRWTGSNPYGQPDHGHGFQTGSFRHPVGPSASPWPITSQDGGSVGIAVWSACTGVRWVYNMDGQQGDGGSSTRRRAWRCRWQAHNGRGPGDTGRRTGSNV